LSPSRLKASSSVIVLPTSLAPAASRASTAGADVVAAGWLASQCGFPAPVWYPATSIRSLTAKVRPLSRPRPVGSLMHLGPGVKAPCRSRLWQLVSTQLPGQRGARERRAVMIALESVTKPKHFLTFHTVASVQKSGEVVEQQSVTSRQPYPKKFASVSECSTH
jgi:hypothetical protein